MGHGHIFVNGSRCLGASRQASQRHVVRLVELEHTVRREMESRLNSTVLLQKARPTECEIVC